MLGFTSNLFLDSRSRILAIHPSKQKSGSSLLSKVRQTLHVWPCNAPTALPEHIPRTKFHIQMLSIPETTVAICHYSGRKTRQKFQNGREHNGITTTCPTLPEKAPKAAGLNCLPTATAAHPQQYIVHPGPQQLPALPCHLLSFSNHPGPLSCPV